MGKNPIEKTVEKKTVRSSDSLFKKQQSVLKAMQSGWNKARELPDEERKKIQALYSSSAEYFVNAQKALAKALDVEIFPI